MLIINRYKCPTYDKTFIVAHELKGYTVIRSSPKMTEEQFKQYYKGKNGIVFDVSKSAMLHKINLIKGI